MVVLIRFLAIGLVILVALWLLRRFLARADPRLRVLLSGVGLNMLRLFLFRRFLPLLFRLVRTLRFFR